MSLYQSTATIIITSPVLSFQSHLVLNSFHQALLLLLLFGVNYKICFDNISFPICRTCSYHPNWSLLFNKMLHLWRPLFYSKSWSFRIWTFWKSVSITSSVFPYTLTAIIQFYVIMFFMFLYCVLFSTSFYFDVRISAHNILFNDWYRSRTLCA